MRTTSLFAAIAVFTASATAQCFDSNYGTSIGSGPDTLLSMQPIGFAFPFCGTTYTDIHVSDKCYAFLSNGGVPAVPFGADITADPFDLVTEGPRICALWSDVQCMTWNNNGEVFLKSTPVSCVVTWKNAQCYSATSGFFDVQMELSISGTIKITYGTGATNNSTPGNNWEYGVVGVSPGQGALLPASLDLSIPGATSDDTCYEFWPFPNGFDMADNALLLTPTNPGWVYLTLGAPTSCASASDYGTGCVQKADSAFELMSTIGFDMAGATLFFDRQPNGYVISNGVPGSIVPPSFNAFPVASWNDALETVGLSQAMPVAGGSTTWLTISSNGRIALGDTFDNGWDYIPQAQTFLDGLDTQIAADWHDYDPGMPGSGSILFEEQGGIAYVTWNGVYSYGTFSPNTFQYQFDLTSGDVTIVYGAYSITGNDHLVGYSVGGVTLSSLALDMSSIGAPAFLADSQNGLGLTTANMPFLGNPAFTLVTSNIDPVLPVAFTLFGDVAINPGIDLTFLGMPTCSAYTNANLVTLSFPVIGSSGVVGFAIPNNPGLIGTTLTAQSLAASLDTPLGFVTSNGTEFMVGN